jgi:L-amino acid N-acyltransferase YncA
MFVRLALESDFPAIVEMARINASQTMAHHTFVPEKVYETCYRYIERANPTMFVVEHNRKVVGFMKASMSEYDFTDGFYTTLEVIFVLPENRGSRAASLLLREFISWSDRLGAKENTGGNDNEFHSEQTARFFEKHGFSRVGYFVRRIRGVSGGKEGRR